MSWCLPDSRGGQSTSSMPMCDLIPCTRPLPPVSWDLPTTCSTVRAGSCVAAGLCLPIAEIALRPSLAGRAYARLGHLKEAQAAVAEVLRLVPNFTIGGTARSITAFKNPEDEQHFFDGMRKAGLQE